MKAPFAPTHILRAGYGYSYDGGNFARAAADTPATLAPDEYAKPNHVIAYLPCGRRIHTQAQAFKPIESEM